MPGGGRGRCDDGHIEIARQVTWFSEHQPNEKPGQTRPGYYVMKRVKSKPNCLRECP
jgi:hypothetical protein